MAKYVPKVGDTIKFTHYKTAFGKTLASETHTGIIHWVASSGKFLSVYPHSIEINTALGEPLDSDFLVETQNIIGLL